MLREASAAGIFVMLVLFVPAVPALPPGCDATLAVEESIQNDAESGGDAGDGPGAAVRILYDDYYWGYLSVFDQSASDTNDWYVFSVAPGTHALMASVLVSLPVVPNEAYLPDNAQRFHLTLRAPDGVEQTVTSAGGVARIVSPSQGDHHIRVWTLPPSAPYACEEQGADLGAPSTPIARNHGLYVGCDPVCAEPPAATLLAGW